MTDEEILLCNECIESQQKKLPAKIPKERNRIAIWHLHINGGYGKWLLFSKHVVLWKTKGSPDV